MNTRVAKVPGSKWKLVDWYIAHLPARRVYLETCFGSGAVLFNKPRSPTEIVCDVDNRVVALFRCVRDRPEERARAVSLTPWARAEWEAARSAPDADNDLELARQFLIVSHQSHGNRTLARSGWRHDGPSGRRGRSVAREWADLPARILQVTQRLQGVHIECRPALDVLRRYQGPEVVVFHDSPYLRDSREGRRDPLYRHEMLEIPEHAELLTQALVHQGPFLACSYRCDLYDDMLLGAGWEVVEAQARAEHGQARVEALYLNPAAVADQQGRQFALPWGGGMLTIVPCTLRAAHAFVAEHHRHHPPAQGGLFALAVAVKGPSGLADAEIVGVAVIGNPVARMLNNGFTAEVTRVCTRSWPTAASCGGVRNGCSALYGAAWKAARALGYRRLITYTMTSESGASLRAAGWLCYGPAGGGTWDRARRARCDKAPTGLKLRWAQEATT